MACRLLAGILTKVVDLGLLELDAALLVRGAGVAVGGLVDGEVGLELAVRLEVARLVGRVAVDHVGLVVLELAEREEDDVTGRDPDLPVSCANIPEAGERRGRGYGSASRHALERPEAGCARSGAVPGACRAPIAPCQTHLLAHLATDLAETRLAVLALGL